MGLVTTYGTWTACLPETVAYIRNLDIFALCVVTAQLEHQSFDVRFNFLLGNLFHSLGNSVDRGKEKIKLLKTATTKQQSIFILLRV